MGSDNEIKAIREMIDANREKLRHAQAIILDASQLIKSAMDRNEQIDQRLANLKPHRGPDTQRNIRPLLVPTCGRWFSPSVAADWTSRRSLPWWTFPAVRSASISMARRCHGTAALSAWKSWRQI